jgi:catechol 2,3-dioxygenase-like lactoylglutathione lyase family enzyme
MKSGLFLRLYWVPYTGFLLHCSPIPQFQHIAFKVASLAALKSLYQHVQQYKLPIRLTADHGVSFAFYFDDPDGNMIGGVLAHRTCLPSTLPEATRPYRER